MINPMEPQKNNLNDLEQYRIELLDTIINEDSRYPWELTEEGIDDYFNQLDSLIIDENDLNPEPFFGYLENCWQNLDNQTLETSLKQKFGQLIPQELYQAIVNEAQKIIQEELTEIQQLIECVKPLLNNWGEEDLQTFARPLIYATRGQKNASRQEIDWENLSEVKKARLTMEMAHFALTQLTIDN